MNNRHPTDVQPDPNSGWSRSIVELRNATVVAPETAGFRQHCGVFDDQHKLCPHATTWRNGNRMTLHPKTVPDVSNHIPGRWLWGGVLFKHFGHFMVESTSRLWALDHFNKPISGIVFVNKRPKAGTAISGYRHDFVNLLYPNLPIYVVKGADRFEELIVAGQGLGLGKIAEGTPELVGSFHKRLTDAVEAQGPECLYISRSRLPLATSGILGEEKLEYYLSQAGYTIFHPEEHSLTTQIAHYKAAKKIIVADGSAAHLLAFVCRSDQDIAYIVRRADWSEGPIEQLTNFRKKPIVVVHFLKNEWVPKDSSKYKYIRFGELDLPKVQSALAEAGFFEMKSKWPVLEMADVSGALQNEGLLADFVPI